MESDGDMRIAEKVARDSAILVRDYIEEMRRQGRIKGKLSLVVTDGKRRIKVPFSG